MRISISTLFIVFLVISSCKDRIICPAFQSTYILDDSTRFAYYSPLWKLDKATRDKYLAEQYGGNDSLAVGNSPDGIIKYFTYASDYVQPAEEVRRTKYGIIKYEPAWLKNFKMKSAPMENVLSPEEKIEIEEDSIDIGEFVASDFVFDSLASDSLAMASLDSMAIEDVDVTDKPKGPKYKYGYDPNDRNNVEQWYYNKYFGKLLVDTRPPKPKVEKTAEITEAVMPTDSSQLMSPVDTTQVEKKGLFKRKDKDKLEEGEENDGGF